MDISEGLIWDTQSSRLPYNQIHAQDEQTQVFHVPSFSPIQQIVNSS